MKVFLGGTCNNSIWREELIPMLQCDYFNPVVKDWTEACQEEERFQRKTCDYVLYVITPLMLGVYSIAEVIDDSNKIPEKTIFCVLNKDNLIDDGIRAYPGIKEFTKEQIKSLEQVGRMVVQNGGISFTNLKGVADYLNHKNQDNRYQKIPIK
jgi:hypothetical protein